MSLDKPDQAYPSAPQTSSSPFPVYIPDPSIRGDAFDQLLQNRGIRFIHSIAAPCPNLTSIDANNHSPDCEFCDNSQIMHLPPGKEIWGVFTSNTLEKMFEIQGVWEIGTTVVTFPTEYADGVQADFNTYDELICPDFLVRLNDLKAYKPTTNNRQKLRYPIAKISSMVSVRGGSLYAYIEDTDFKIVNGEIEWQYGNYPAYDPATGLGEIVSITYAAHPVYAVLNAMHELRVTQEYDIATGTKIAKRLPQQVLVRRDFLITDSNKIEQ